MSDEITRQEFNNSIGRLHEEVKSINNCTIQIKADAKYMKESTQQMHQIIFGNSRPGLITKVSNIFTILKIHFWLIGLIVIGLLSTAWFVIRKGV